MWPITNRSQYSLLLYCILLLFTYCLWTTTQLPYHFVNEVKQHRRRQRPTCDRTWATLSLTICLLLYLTWLAHTHSTHTPHTPPSRMEVRLVLNSLAVCVLPLSSVGLWRHTHIYWPEPFRCLRCDQIISLQVTFSEHHTAPRLSLEVIGACVPFRETFVSFNVE